MQLTLQRFGFKNCSLNQTCQVFKTWQVFLSSIKHIEL